MGNVQRSKIAPSKECGIICNCFNQDKNVKSTNVLRNCKVKWLWTDNHQAALETSAKSSDLPTDIVSIIGDYTSSSNDNYHTLKDTTFTEKLYHTPKLLQKKKLCAAFFSQPSMKHTLTLILLASKSEKRRMANLFKYRFSLPALNVSDATDRTVNIDGISIRMNLVYREANHKNISELDDQFTNFIYVIESNETKECERIVSSIRSVNRSLNDCIFFGKKGVPNAVSNKYNIPYVQTRSGDDEDVNDLFTFAIKYFWFSKVYHPSIVL
eukprot:6466_1